MGMSQELKAPKSSHTHTKSWHVILFGGNHCYYKKRKTSSDHWRNMFKNPWEASFFTSKVKFPMGSEAMGPSSNTRGFALSSSYGKPLNFFPRLKTPPVMKWLSCRNFAPPMASHEANFTRQCLTTEWMG